MPRLSREAEVVLLLILGLALMALPGVLYVLGWLPPSPNAADLGLGWGFPLGRGGLGSGEDADRLGWRGGGLGPVAVVGAFEAPVGHLALDDPGEGPQPAAGQQSMGDLGEGARPGGGEPLRGKRPPAR